MAVSATRLAQLIEEFKPVKGQIEQIDRKYSLDYVDPDLNMPESLDLPRIEFVPKTDEELNDLALEQVRPSYLADIRRAETARANGIAAIDRKRLTLEEKTRQTQAKYLAAFTAETTRVNNKMINNGLLYSSVLTAVKQKAQDDYESNVAESNAQAQAGMAIYDEEQQVVESNFNSAKLSVEQERDARQKAAYNKLKQKDEDERVRIEKYNNQLEEKETKYKFNRARSLELIRQAEYNRAYAARKLYQQMGSVGYEEAMLWEKYNVFLRHFGAFNKREEALTHIQIDNYVRGHLKQNYDMLVDWINRNVPV